MQLSYIRDVKENIHFLDIGCGTGWAVGEAAKLVDYKGMFYGVDLSPKMIEKAKSNFRGKDNFHFIQLTFKRLSDIPHNFYCYRLHLLHNY